MNLYTKEFFELCRSRLTSDGLLLQWTPYYDDHDVLRVMRAFFDTFEHVEVFHGVESGALSLIGSKSPIRIDRARIDRLLRDPQIRSDLDEGGSTFFTRASDLERIYVGDATSLGRLTGRVPPLTDDRPVMEYRLLREIARTGTPYRPFQIPREATKPLAFAGEDQPRAQ